MVFNISKNRHAGRISHESKTGIYLLFFLLILFFFIVGWDQNQDFNEQDGGKYRCGNPPAEGGPERAKELTGFGWSASPDDCIHKEPFHEVICSGIHK